MASMIKLTGPRQASFEVVDNSGVASVLLDGNPLSTSTALDGVTAGSVTASKAIIVDANKSVSTFGSITANDFVALTAMTTNLLAAISVDTTNLTFEGESSLDINSAAVSATGNDTTQTATITKFGGTITTGALTTAGGASTNVVLTDLNVVAGDVILVTLAGGTNTTSVVVESAIATTSTITVKLRNNTVATALNGTVAFHYLRMH